MAKRATISRSSTMPVTARKAYPPPCGMRTEYPVPMTMLQSGNDERRNIVSSPERTLLRNSALGESWFAWPVTWQRPTTGEEKPAANARRDIVSSECPCNCGLNDGRVSIGRLDSANVRPDLAFCQRT
jgi:hypothetical protein